MAWLYSDIRTKIRRLTGRLSANQLSDATILEFANHFYQETLPGELLNLSELESWWEFTTSVNDEDYILSAINDYILGAPLFVAGNQISFYRDPEEFYANYPQLYVTETLATGDGVLTTFNYTTLKNPLKPGTAVVDDQVETFTSSAGVLTGDKGGTGTVNATTGVTSVTFNTAPASGQLIRIQYEYWSTGVPVSGLWYENELVLRPVPNEVYPVKVKRTQIPSPFVLDSDKPLYNDWGKLIAYGASIDILNDYEGPAIAMKFQGEYRHQLNIVNRRNLRLLEGKRARPNF